MTAPNAVTPSETVEEAKVWYSVRKACWVCQIGASLSHHYNEEDALRYGREVAGNAGSRSVWVGELIPANLEQGD